MVLRLQKNDQGEYTKLASIADVFHGNTTQDKKNYVTVIYQEYIKLVEKYPAQSIPTINGVIYTEVQKIMIQNSYLAFKNIQKVNIYINFLEFRLLLAKELLRARMKNIPDSSQTIQAPQPKQSNIGVNTDVMDNFSVENMEILPKINFHVPCKCAPPKQLKNKLVCLVCRRPQTEFVECKQCSDVSGKLITLCGQNSFPFFIRSQRSSYKQPKTFKFYN